MKSSQGSSTLGALGLITHPAAHPLSGALDAYCQAERVPRHLQILYNAAYGDYVLLFHADTPKFTFPTVGVARAKDITGKHPAASSLPCTPSSSPSKSSPPCVANFRVQVFPMVLPDRQYQMRDGGIIRHDSCHFTPTWPQLPDDGLGVLMDTCSTDVKLQAGGCDLQGRTNGCM